jgi:hypothetical protein
MTALNISLNLKDLFIEAEGEEGYFEIGLADAIKQSLLAEARNTIRKLVGDQVTQLLRETFSSRFDLIINAMADSHLESFQESAEFKEKYNTTSLADLIEQKINRIDFDLKADRIVRTSAESHIKEIREKFDERYAAGVVEGLNKNGLLNKQAANLLLKNS